MHKQVISFVQVIKFLENMDVKGGGLTPKPPLRTPLSVKLKLAMLKVSKGAIGRCTFYCHSYFLEMS